MSQYSKQNRSPSTHSHASHGTYNTTTGSTNMPMPYIPPVPAVSRPTGMRRKPSANTRYMQMLLDLDSVPKWHNIVVAIAAWTLLAGFVIFPGTFASIQSIDDNSSDANSIEGWVLHHVRNLPLLVVAGVCCAVGALIMILFWIRWRRNYVWICNRIFMVSTK